MSRSYLYQIAVSKLPPNYIKGPRTSKISTTRIFRKRLPLIQSRLPAFIGDRYLEVRSSDFDADQFVDCLKCMEGSHNFKAFCSSQGWTKHIKLPDGSNVSELRTDEEFQRMIPKIDVSEAPNPCPLDPFYMDNFKFYQVQIKGKAFLHNQIRRMIGAALGVGEGRLTREDVQKMLQNPSLGWNKKGRVVPPHGLHLLDVEYTQESLQSATEDVNLLPLPPLGPMPEGLVQFQKDNSSSRADSVT